MRQGDIRLVAQGLCFSSLVAMVPFLAVSLAVFKLLGAFDYYYPKVESILLQNLTSAAGESASSILRSSIHRVQAGKLGGIGGLVLIFYSFQLMQDMDDGIHRLWNLKGRRPLLKKILFYFLFIVVMPLFLSVYVALLSFRQGIPYMRDFPVGIFNSAVLMLFVYFLYKYVPTTKVQSKSALVSTLLVSSVLYGLKESFAYVVKTFFSYDRMYGSVAALAAFLLWIQALWWILLAGAALTASLDRRQLLNDLKVKRWKLQNLRTWNRTNKS
jgi:membrane protein